MSAKCGLAARTRRHLSVGIGGDLAGQQQPPRPDPAEDCKSCAKGRGGNGSLLFLFASVPPSHKETCVATDNYRVRGMLYGRV